MYLGTVRVGEAELSRGERGERERLLVEAILS